MKFLMENPFGDKLQPGPLFNFPVNGKYEIIRLMAAMVKIKYMPRLLNSITDKMIVGTMLSLTLLIFCFVCSDFLSWHLNML